MEETDIFDMKNQKNKILEKFKTYLKQKDQEKIVNFNFLPFFQFLELKQKRKNYLNLNISRFKIQFFFQLRLSNNLFLKINIFKKVYLFDFKKVCDCCHPTEQLNLYHILCECYKYTDIRKKILGIDSHNDMHLNQKLLRLLDETTVENINKLHDFYINVIKLDENIVLL